MFLSEEIPQKLSSEETVARIKSQGGLVCIPHPYDTMRLSAFKNHGLEAIIQEVDIIEVFNSRSLSPKGSARAKELAEKYNKFQGAGSDAHTLPEIGNAYIEMPDFKGKDDFLKSLAQGKIFGHRSNPSVHFASTWARFKKRLL